MLDLVFRRVTVFKRVANISLSHHHLLIETLITIVLSQLSLRRVKFSRFIESIFKTRVVMYILFALTDKVNCLRLFWIPFGMKHLVGLNPTLTVQILPHNYSKVILLETPMVCHKKVQVKLRSEYITQITPMRKSQPRNLNVTRFLRLLAQSEQYRLNRFFQHDWFCLRRSFWSLSGTRTKHRRLLYWHPQGEFEWDWR